MKPRVLVDTGPLVAFLNRADRYYKWAVDRAAAISPPLFTCEAVVSEACFLLRDIPNAPDALLELVKRKLVTVPFQLESEITAVKKLMTRYANVPMSLADACLVRMSEQYAGSIVLTLDRDFRIYRRLGRQVIPVITPD